MVTLNRNSPKHKPNTAAKRHISGYVVANIFNAQQTPAHKMAMLCSRSELTPLKSDMNPAMTRPMVFVAPGTARRKHIVRYKYVRHIQCDVTSKIESIHRHVV